MLLYYVDAGLPCLYVPLPKRIGIYLGQHVLTKVWSILYVQYSPKSRKIKFMCTVAIDLSCKRFVTYVLNDPT